MEKILKEAIKKNKSMIHEGKVADYIPALKKANPKDIGVAIADLEGNIYKAGEYDTKFTIQSISKVISLALAIMENGQDEVFKKIGYEGTDEPFNTLYKLDFPHIDKPANPMINAGAILTTSLIHGRKEEKFQKILELVRTMANDPDINYSEEVYKSEKSTGEKNRAMAYIMKANGILEEPVEDALDTYFKQCSIEVDAVDLANIGAFIANDCKGLDLKETISNKKLSTILMGVMATSGMYNFSGEYLVEVGLPSKSGVGGGIMGAVPSKLGIGVYSPALDENGNSAAGYGIMQDLSKKLELSIF